MAERLDGPLRDPIAVAPGPVDVPGVPDGPNRVFDMQHGLAAPFSIDLEDLPV